MSKESGTSAADESPRRRTTGWAKTLLVVSVLLMVAGGGLTVYSMIRGDDDASSVGEIGVDTSRLEAPGFAPGVASSGGDATGTSPSSTLDAWSPTIFRYGFSFFLGFCIGFAVRTFLKISMVAIGVIALAGFGLQYAGIIDVDWNALSGHYDSVAQWLRDQTSSFTGFIQGHLPSAGLAALGLVAGFRKR